MHNNVPLCRREARRETNFPGYLKFHLSTTRNFECLFLAISKPDWINQFCWCLFRFPRQCQVADDSLCLVLIWECLDDEWAACLLNTRASRLASHAHVKMVPPAPPSGLYFANEQESRRAFIFWLISTHFALSPPSVCFYIICLGLRSIRNLFTHRNRKPFCAVGQI
jgi:hypothetical protein